MEETYAKVFTGTQIIIRGLENILDENNITSLIKNHNESARLGGFGLPLNSVELFILKADIEKAQPFIDKYKVEINS